MEGRVQARELFVKRNPGTEFITHYISAEKGQDPIYN